MKRLNLIFLLVILSACGSDSDDYQPIIKVEQFGNDGTVISCSGKRDGYFYWNTLDSECALYCVKEEVRDIQCHARRGRI